MPFLKSQSLMKKGTNLMIVQAPNEYKPTTPRQGSPGVWYWADAVPGELDLDRARPRSTPSSRSSTETSTASGPLGIRRRNRLRGPHQRAARNRRHLGHRLYEVDTMIHLALVAADLHYEWRRIFNDFPVHLQRPETDPLLPRLQGEVLPHKEGDD